MKYYFLLLGSIEMGAEWQQMSDSLTWQIFVGIVAFDLWRIKIKQAMNESQTFMALQIMFYDLLHHVFIKFQLVIVFFFL